MVYDRKKELKDTQPTPISDYVQVDFSIPGCPPDNKQILEFIKDVVMGKMHHDYDKPVCFECRMNENRCLLLTEGKPCLGPITKGGCNAICTNAGWECWGCRGHTPDANIDVMIKLLQEKGFKKGFVDKRMRAFVATEFEKAPKIKLNDNLAVQYKYPTFSDFLKLTNQANNSIDIVLEVASLCLDKIFTQNKVVNCSEVSQKEIIEFLNNLPKKEFNIFCDFFRNMPKLQYKEDFLNPITGKTFPVEVSDFSSFFIL